MKKNLIYWCVGILFCSCSNESVIDKKIERQMEYMVELVRERQTDELVAPRTIKDDELVLVPSKDWTSGFFAGSLWQTFELTRNKKWEEYADYYTQLLEKEQYNSTTHDLGFMMYCSYGKGYELTCNKKYREVLLQTAKTLVGRYDPNVGCIRSWDFNTDVWMFPVIIDNMMNLELLYWASKETENPYFADIATKHAITTMNNHFRADNSSYHVVDYDPETGAVRKKNTHQGFNDESAWSRGQAWGLYGFTMCYRETKNQSFLDMAERIAEFVFDNQNMPSDYIPYWDFNAPDIPNEPRDASAAAIIASALYELAQYSDKQEQHKARADKIMGELSTAKYFAKPGSNGGFLLKHSTGHFPAGTEIDCPINYADYYYIEALNRRMKYVND